jgi:hypothetical protein
MAGQEMPELLPLASGPWSISGETCYAAQCPDIRAEGGDTLLNELRWGVTAVGMYVQLGACESWGGVGY